MPVEVRIYNPPDAANPRFRRAGITSACVSITTTSNFYAPGSFQIEIPAGVPYASELRKYNLVCVGRRFWGLILGVEFAASGQSDTLTATGSDLKGLLDRLTVPPELTDVTGAAGYDPAGGPSETIMKHFVANNVTNSLQPSRNIPGFVIAPDQLRGLAGDKYMTRFEMLPDVLQKIGEAAKLGWDIVPDLENGRFVFDVIEGADRTASQSDRPRILFSAGRGTVESQSYLNSDAGMKNVFYATRSGAEFADEALTAVYVRDGEEQKTGIYRREQHLSVSADTPAAGDEYELISEG